MDKSSGLRNQLLRVQVPPSLPILGGSTTEVRWSYKPLKVSSTLLRPTKNRFIVQLAEQRTLNPSIWVQVPMNLPTLKIEYGPVV